jgi:flagellar hook-associated protein 2
MGIDGLVSGLNTTDIINQLMQVEQAPQAALKTTMSKAQSFLTALQSLNTKVASLTDAAKTAAKADSWKAFQASSTSTSVKATATSSAAPGTVSFTVDQVATAQVGVSKVTADDGSLVSGLPPAVTIRSHDGTLVTVQPTTGSLQDVAKAINDAADSGIKATVVRVSGGTTPTYRLQFSGTETGADGSFEVYAGDKATVQAAVDANDTAALAAARLDTSTVSTAKDAQITLWKGSGVEQTYTQSSNTFKDLLTGVDVTVSQRTTDPVTVTVGQDSNALQTLVSNLVSNMGVVLSEIASRTATTTTKNADGTTSVTGGLFTGDSTVRNAQQGLTDALLAPVGGLSPSTIGISYAKDGTFSFDAAKFQEALAADPAKVQAMATGLADRVATVSKSYSDPTEGTLSLKLNSQNDLIKDYGTQISNWDDRLALRRETLQAQFSALEVSMSKLKSQSSWLTSQIAKLNAST